MANPCLQPKLSDFRGYPFEALYTLTKVQSFQRNNCSSGQTGTYIEYSKVYESNVSQSDLQTKISNDAANFNSEGQANANSNGSCTIPANTTKANSRPKRIVGFDSTYVWGTPHDNTGGLYRYNKSSVLSGSLSTATLLHNAKPEGMNWPFSAAGQLHKPVRSIVSGQNRLAVNFYGTSNPETAPYNSGMVNISLGSSNYMWPRDKNNLSFYGGPGHPFNGYFFTYSSNSIYNCKMVFVRDGGTVYDLGVIPTLGDKYTINYMTDPPIIASNGSFIYLVFVKHRYVSLDYPTTQSGFDTTRGYVTILALNNDPVTGYPTAGFTVLYNAYSANQPRCFAVANMGADILVFIDHNGANIVRVSGSGSYADPPNVGAFDWAVGNGTELFATVGDNRTGQSPPPTRILRYLKSSNSWTTLYS